MDVQVLHGGCNGVMHAERGDAQWTLSCEQCGAIFRRKRLETWLYGKVVADGHHHRIHRLLPIWEEDSANHPAGAQTFDLGEALETRRTGDVV